MINVIKVTNQSEQTLELNMRSSWSDHGLLIFNLEGLGPPKATVSGSGGPNFDGIRAGYVRADARQIVLTLAVTAYGEAEEEARSLIYTYFPIKQEITFEVETDRNHVYIPAIVEENEFNQFAKVENAVISLYCPNPYFLNMIEHSIVIGDTTAIPIFEFPFENDSLINPMLEFGEVTTLPTAEIPYNGQVETGIDMVLDFDGAATDIVITNDNGNQEMNIDTGDVEPLANGDQIIINTRVGEKSIFHVRGSTWTNIMNSVPIGDDWITIRPGGNRVIVNAATGIANVDTELKYRALSEGV